MAQIDLFARHIHYVDHLAPIWNKLPGALRGSFYLPACLAPYANTHLDATGLVFLNPQPGQDEIGVVPPEGHTPLLSCAYGDMMKVHRSSPERALILMQHGVGLTFGTAAYADGYGGNRHVNLLLLPSQYVADRVREEIAAARAVIGTPKLDVWASAFEKYQGMPEKPVIAISFHHGDQAVIPPEAGSAQAYYSKIIPELAKHFNIIGHSHPFSRARDMEMFRRAGIEFVPDFDDVMHRADVYINDCSSTAYEFLVTGKPVILLNAPWFRKTKLFGLRFWDYSNIGPQVDHPRDLMATIERVVLNPGEYRDGRQTAVENLYPMLGNAAQASVKELEKFSTPTGISGTVETKITPVPGVRAVSGSNKHAGIVYMCFGHNAEKEIGNSISTLRKNNPNMPVAVVGDTKVSGTQFIRWEGASPFDESREKGLRFLAGRVKPFLYHLSPFENTLYMDADTQFVHNIRPGFDFLKAYDVAIAEENQKLSDLHNPGSTSGKYSWYHHMDEVRESIKELGDPSMRFLNSGVIFFRKAPACEKLFTDWYEEWLRWQQWDEQMAFLRAVKKNPHLKLKRLPVCWNSHYPARDAIILHMCARGAARKDGIG